MPCAPFPGGGAFPSLEGTKERVGVLIPEEEGRFVQLNSAVSKIVVCQLAPGLLHEFLESDVSIGKATLQCAGARAEFPRDLLERRAFTRERALEGVLDLFTHVGAGVPLLEFGLQLSADRLKQLFVLGNKRPVDVAVTKHERVARGLEP